ncbi:MAG: terminase large subunit [Gammaproteobacteria bacterium]|nr:terminase large subunit [Gammaproteobacteria bacterium]MDE0273542.1 terminase large subunit [Gammaproteobacteria bacterium]
MPYADDDRKVERQRQRRAEARAAARPKPLPPPKPPRSPAAALQRWCRKTLIVPPGHKDAGKPMSLPGFGLDFMRDALTHRESALIVARKNAKSAVIACYLLARLVGPLRTAGYRGGVCSVNRDKAAELWRQCEEIAEASGLDGLRFLRAKKHIEGPSGTVEVLSADKSAGHASGFDDAIFDELGLLDERHRSLVSGLLSSISARNGRFIALSILGHGPFLPEMIERKDDPAVAVHLHQADEGCQLDDPKAWRDANPGLGRIKSRSYMADMARRALASSADQRDFRAFDLNQPVDPAKESIIPIDQWIACLSDDPPPRSGPVVGGFDAGGSDSMTAFVAVWPDTGRLECYGGFGDKPDLSARGSADGVGGEYRHWEREGNLWTYPGRVTPAGGFLKDVAARLAGEQVIAVSADRYRVDDVRDAWDESGRVFGGHVWSFRGTGAAAHADGTKDIRAFQRLVKARKIHPDRQAARMLTFAIKESEVRYDPGGNEALDKRKHRSRIDALQAAVIAAGHAERYLARKARQKHEEGPLIRIVGNSPDIGFAGG